MFERDSWKGSFKISDGAVGLPLEASYRLYAPKKGGRGPVPLLVCLHRYGGDPDRFSRIVPWLDLAGFAFLFPKGPFRIPTPKGQIQYAWAVSTPKETDPAGRDFSLGFVGRLAEEAASRLPVAPERTFLLGHSQGGYLALHALLAHPARFAGAVCLGGHLNEELARRDLAGARGRKTLLLHGNKDDLIPIRRAEETLAILAEGGADAELRRYGDVGHWPTRAMYADAGKWLKARLK